jgi:hypothetical protein
VEAETHVPVAEGRRIGACFVDGAVLAQKPAVRDSHIFQYHVAVVNAVYAFLGAAVSDGDAGEHFVGLRTADG